jgi:hypothetical protein
MYRQCIDGELCQNDGECIIYGNLFACVCPPNYTGMYCDEPMESTITAPLTCSPDPCNGHGSCIPYTNGSFYLCICQMGFSGTYCEVSPSTVMKTTTRTTTTLAPGSTCKPNPCQFHGTCVPYKNGTFFMCVCQSGYSGTYCELQPTTTAASTTTVSTPAGLVMSANECFPNPCFNDGICSLTSEGKFSGCLCRGHEYSGYYCQTYDICKRKRLSVCLSVDPHIYIFVVLINVLLAVLNLNRLIAIYKF